MLPIVAYEPGPGLSSTVNTIKLKKSFLTIFDGPFTHSVLVLFFFTLVRVLSRARVASIVRLITPSSMTDYTVPSFAAGSKSASRATVE